MLNIRALSALKSYRRDVHATFSGDEGRSGGTPGPPRLALCAPDEFRIPPIKKAAIPRKLSDEYGNPLSYRTDICGWSRMETESVVFMSSTLR